MISELYLEGNNVDISADISSLLTFAIDDIRDTGENKGEPTFGHRHTAVSKTIVLPGTARNNALLGNIFETGHSNAYNPLLDNVGYNFNPSKSARCIIFQDNLQTFKGTMRLLEIIKDGHSIEYEVALNGELTSLNVALSAGYLTDLDFSAYDTTYSVANIVASWDNAPGSGVYFPHIDYGTYSTLKHDWKYKTFRPALYAKEYIDKMVAAAHFRYDCALFNTARFKSLVVPNNQKELYRKSTKQFDVQQLTNNAFTQADGYVNMKLNFFTQTTLGNFTSNVFRNEYTYNSSTALNGTMYLAVSGTYTKANSASTFDVSILKNGSLLTGAALSIFGGSSTAGSFDILISAAGSTINLNDVITVAFNAVGAGATYSINYDTANLYFKTGATETIPVSIGEQITINDQLPQNVKQIDFFTSIIKLFNLYVYEDKFDERLIHIAPFVDFYSTDSSNAVDWTYKLNRDKPIRIKPMSELNSKVYNFRYKDDNDFFNADYKKRYNQGYGSYVFDSEFEFASQTSNLELIFAATPLVGWQGEDKVYSTIFKKSGTTEENIDSIIRLLQTKKVTGVTRWDILADDGATTLGGYTDYGYAGHLNDPDNPTNDINFGVLKELYFTLVTGNLTVTQFAVYWSSYMAEITDKDSKMLTGRFYLTPQDVFDLDFSKYVYVDGVLFRLNKIADYNTTIPSDCQGELIKTINTIY